MLSTAALHISKPSATCICRIPAYRGTMTTPLQHRVRTEILSNSLSHSAQQTTAQKLHDGDELDDAFTGLDGGTGVMTVAGFGSLLSERSARTTFPDLHSFRPGRLYGYRRVFAHTADIFFERGIANMATHEIGSLSCEPISSTSGSSNNNDNGSTASTSSNGTIPSKQSSLVVSLFEVPYTPDNVAAFIEREHEFRFLAVRPYDVAGKVPAQHLAVLCGSNTDEHYKATRCPSDEWERRWGVHGIQSVWSNDVLPCRVYLRHCVLAAKGFSAEAYASFLDDTFLSDRVTTIRQYLDKHPEIMDEQPPPALVGRYSG